MSGPLPSLDAIPIHRPMAVSVAEEPVLEVKPVKAAADPVILPISRPTAPLIPDESQEHSRIQDKTIESPHERLGYRKAPKIGRQHPPRTAA